MKELPKLQDMEEEFEIKLEKERKQYIKNFIKVCLKLNQDNNFIINTLVESCNISKEDAEEYMELYNKGEL